MWLVPTIIRQSLSLRHGMTNVYSLYANTMLIESPSRYNSVGFETGFQERICVVTRALPVLKGWTLVRSRERVRWTCVIRWFGLMFIRDWWTRRSYNDLVSDFYSSWIKTTSTCKQIFCFFFFNCRSFSLSVKLYWIEGTFMWKNSIEFSRIGVENTLTRCSHDRRI